MCTRVPLTSVPPVASRLDLACGDHLAAFGRSLGADDDRERVGPAIERRALGIAVRALVVDAVDSRQRVTDDALGNERLHARSLTSRVRTVRRMSCMTQGGIVSRSSFLRRSTIASSRRRLSSRNRLSAARRPS